MVGILKRRRSFCVFLPLFLLNSLSLPLFADDIYYAAAFPDNYLLGLNSLPQSNEFNWKIFISQLIYNCEGRREVHGVWPWANGQSGNISHACVCVCGCVGERESSLLEASRQVQVHVEVEVVELFAGTRYVTTTTGTPTRTAMGTGIRLAALFFNW